MFSTSEFYSYCRVHDVDVIPFDRLPAAATTVRYHGAYAVGLNFSRLHTVRQMRTAMLHESGHLHTGALHKVNSPFQLVEQNEYRADADAFHRVCRRKKSARRYGQAAQNPGSWQNILTWTKTT